jgi:hypothetical protein
VAVSRRSSGASLETFCLVVELGEGKVDLKLVQAGMVSIIVGHSVLTQVGALAADSVGNLGSFVLHRFVLADD